MGPGVGWPKPSQTICWPYKKIYHVSLAFCPQRDVVAAGSYDGFVRLWTADGVPLGEFRASGRAVQSLVWSKDGRYIFTGDAGGSVRRWVATWTGLMTLGARAIAPILSQLSEIDQSRARELVRSYNH